MRPSLVLPVPCRSSSCTQTSEIQRPLLPISRWPFGRDSTWTSTLRRFLFGVAVSSCSQRILGVFRNLPELLAGRCVGVGIREFEQEFEREAPSFRNPKTTCRQPWISSSVVCCCWAFWLSKVLCGAVLLLSFCCIGLALIVRKVFCVEALGKIMRMGWNESRYFSFLCQRFCTYT